MEPIIRHAVIGDLFWLRLLLGQLVTESGDSYPYMSERDLETVTAILAGRLGAQDEDLMVYVAENDAVIVGFIWGNLCGRVGHPQRYLQIPYLYVAPGFRATGLGRTLSATLISDAKECGAEAVEFLARPSDQQWYSRGWPIVAQVHSLPVDSALASIVPSKPANGHGTHAAEE